MPSVGDTLPGAKEEDWVSGLPEGSGFKSAERVERLEHAPTLGDSLA